MKTVFAIAAVFFAATAHAGEADYPDQGGPRQSKTAEVIQTVRSAFTDACENDDALCLPGGRVPAEVIASNESVTPSDGTPVPTPGSAVMAIGSSLFLIKRRR